MDTFNFPSVEPSVTGSASLSPGMTLGRSLLDAPRFIPGESQKAGSSTHSAGVEELKGEPLKKTGEARVRVRPGDEDLSDTMLRTGHAGNPGMQIRLIATAIQVPPEPFRSMIPTGASVATRRAWPTHAGSMPCPDVDTSLLSVDGDAFDCPWLRQHHQVLVQSRIRHKRAKLFQW